MESLELRASLQRQAKKYETLTRLEAQVVAAGFILFDPDFFEQYDRVLADHGPSQNRDVVKVISPTGDLLVLRPDVTTSLSRQLIPQWQEGEEVKLFYRTAVFHQKPGRGIVVTRQFGLEWFGSTAASTDAATVQLAAALLADLNGQALLEIGDTTFLEAWFTESGLDLTHQKRLREALEQKNHSDFRHIIASSILAEPLRHVATHLFACQGSLSEIAQHLDVPRLPVSLQRAWRTLTTLDAALAQTEQSIRRVYDLTMVSPQNYYDGIIFKAYLDGVAVPVLRGGRYNPLTRRFGREIPAIGLAIDLDTWLEAVMRDA